MQVNVLRRVERSGRLYGNYILIFKSLTTMLQKQQLNDGEKKIEKYIIKLKRPIGKGAYAQVYLGRCITNNQPVAVKVIDKKIFANHYNLKNIQSEIEIMKKVEHKNIVRLLDVYQTTNNMYIITEFCEEGDLMHFVKRRKKVPEKQAVRLLKDITDGFRYLHSLGITHRDLKPANILLKNGRCKISDFGFAKNLQYGEYTVMNSVVGTPLYMSPQILNRTHYTNKSDLWSVGLIYYELLHGYTPWPANNEIQLVNNIMNRQIMFDSSISERSKEWIRASLKIKEEDRMSWEEAFTHPLFSQLQRLEDNKENNPTAERQRNRSTSTTVRRDRSPGAARQRDGDISAINKTPRSKLDRFFEIVTPTKNRRTETQRDLSALKNNRNEVVRPAENTTRDLLKLLNNNKAN